MRLLSLARSWLLDLPASSHAYKLDRVSRLSHPIFWIEDHLKLEVYPPPPEVYSLSRLFIGISDIKGEAWGVGSKPLGTLNQLCDKVIISRQLLL